MSVFTSQCIVDDQTITYSETDIVQKIDAVISVLKKKNLLTNQNPLFSEKKLRIKISGDGFQRSMKNGNVSFSFVVLDTEEVHSTLASWNVLIAECAENDHQLHAVSKPLMDKIDQILSSNKISGKTGDIIVDLYLVAD